MEKINDRKYKPNLKKCKDCGNYGMPNRTCKYWSYDNITEWTCSHPQAIKKEKENRNGKDNL